MGSYLRLIDFAYQKKMASTRLPVIKRAPAKKYAQPVSTGPLLHLLRRFEELEVEQPLGRHVQRFRGGLVFKAHRLLYHSTLGSRVIKKKKKRSLSRRGCSSTEVRGGAKTSSSLLLSSLELSDTKVNES